jgi:hypothetical protein
MPRLDVKSRHLESRAKAAASVVIEVSAGWASPSSHACGLATPTFLHRLLETETL